MHDEPTGGYPRTMVFILSYKRNFLISMLNLVTLALLTVNMYTKKEAAVQISKRRCTLGSYKGEVARSHPLFLSENSISLL
jgi:hypothetical protein